jgi:hypothetical protein
MLLFQFFFYLLPCEPPPTAQKIQFSSNPFPLELPLDVHEQSDARFIWGAVADGQVVVMRGAAIDWPLLKEIETCDDFCSNPVLSDMMVKLFYSGTEEGFAPIASIFNATNVTSPWYFNMHGFPEKWPWLHRKLGDIPNLTNSSKGNKRDLVENSEFWISPGPGAGARPHIDTHTKYTVVVQITGTRKWVIEAPPSPSRVTLVSRFGDLMSDQYTEESDGWAWAKGNPDHSQLTLNLTRGDVLILPPGTLHSTLNIGTGCALSMGSQLKHPVPVGAFRRWSNEIRLLGDLRDLRTRVMQLTTLGYLYPGPGPLPLGGCEGRLAQGDPNGCFKLIADLAGFTPEKPCLGVQTLNVNSTHYGPKTCIDFHLFNTTARGDEGAQHTLCLDRFLFNVNSWFKSELVALAQVPGALRGTFYHDTDNFGEAISPFLFYWEGGSK